MTAYYNEIDPYAAEWLRNLIKRGHIADGVVDERSIEDVTPNEIREFTQCHFFAGIGIWSHALRLSGWDDTRPVWTGSCPCQPFSTAGKGAGIDDERHLWPHWFHLISECQPQQVFGEQVASKDGLGWLDIVQTDMEGADYTIGAVDLCAASVGAPHIRQRLWFHAERMVDSDGSRLQGRKEREFGSDKRSTGASGVDDRMGDSDSIVHRRRPGETLGAETESGGVIQSDNHRSVNASDGLSRMADSTGGNTVTEREQRVREHGLQSQGRSDVGQGREGSRVESNTNHPTRPTNGFWRDVDWLGCRDGKFRPVRPGTFPLVDGTPGRVGRLRAYGNGIVAEAAAEFIRAATTD